jgi:Rrf2 family protein
LLSQRARYALKALLHLARDRDSDGLRQIGAIAAGEQIPRKFLEAILVDLKHAGLVESVRGHNGGYRLARSPKEITFGDIIRALDGPLALVPCVSKLFYRRCEDCRDEATCAIRHIMAGVREGVSNILDQTSLLDAAKLADQLPVQSKRKSKRAA